MADFPIYRLVKGSQLTFGEMDGNLEWLSKNLSGSQVIISGSTFLTGSIFSEGPVNISGSLANGESVSASGIFSHAEGYQTLAAEPYSHAEGYSTHAYGESSHAEGFSTDALGTGSHAEGNSTSAVGDYSHTEGGSSVVGTRNAYYATSIVNGLVTLSGSYGDVDGDFGVGARLLIYDNDYDNIYGVTYFDIDSIPAYDSVATRIQLVDTSVNTSIALVGDLSNGVPYWNGDQLLPGVERSHAEGNSYVLSSQSHGEGDNTVVLGYAAHAEGQSTIAVGSRSHAEGLDSAAIGGYSHAEGDNTRAIGTVSHAEGVQTQAIGYGSHTEGDTTKTGITTAYYAVSVVNSIITFSSSYGDVSSVFPSGDPYPGLILLDDTFADNIYGKRIFTISETTSYGSYIDIGLQETNINTSVAKIAYANDLSSNTGDQTIPGDYSHAEGSATLAIGNYSHAEGNQTIALGDYQHVQGQFNIILPDQSAFIVGNGTNNLNRSNLVFASGASFQVTGSLGVLGSITSSNALFTETGTFIGKLSVGTPSADSALFEVTSTTKGLLPPRMTQAQRVSISTPAAGLIVYQTNGTEGLYQYKSTGWEQIGAGGGTGGSSAASNLFNYYNFI